MSEARPRALDRDGQVRLWWGRNPVDLFFSYDEFHEEMRTARSAVPFGGRRRFTILSPEHLAVCKAMFDRPKDWLDIEQILVATDPLDLAEIESWLERMVGEGRPPLRQARGDQGPLSLDASQLSTQPAAASSATTIMFSFSTRPAGIERSPASSLASGSRFSAPVTSQRIWRAASIAG